MLQPGPAVTVMFIGMIEGKFTTRKLANYFHEATADWLHARQIINALESADKVAVHAQAFHQALLTASAAPAPAVA